MTAHAIAPCTDYASNRQHLSKLDCGLGQELRLRLIPSDCHVVTNRTDSRAPDEKTHEYKYFESREPDEVPHWDEKNSISTLMDLNEKMACGSGILADVTLM